MAHSNTFRFRSFYDTLDQLRINFHSRELDDSEPLPCSLEDAILLVNPTDFGSITRLATVLAKSLGETLGLSAVKDIIRKLAEALESCLSNLDRVTEVFGAIATLLYRGRNVILQDFRGFVAFYLRTLLLHRKSFVRQFAAEGLAYVLRTLSQTRDLNSGLTLTDAYHIMRNEAWQLFYSANSLDSRTSKVCQGSQSSTASLDGSDKESSTAASGEEDLTSNEDIAKGLSRADEQQSVKFDEERMSEGGDSDDEQDGSIPKDFTELNFQKHNENEQISPLRMVDVLSALCFQTVKSVDHSLVRFKGESTFDFWYSLWLKFGSGFDLLVVQLFLLRVKLHIRFWESAEWGPIWRTLSDSDLGEPGAYRLILSLFTDQPKIRVNSTRNRPLTDAHTTNELPQLVRFILSQLLTRLEAISWSNSARSTVRAISFELIWKTIGRRAFSDWVQRIVPFNVLFEVPGSTDHSESSRHIFGSYVAALLGPAECEKVGVGLQEEETALGESAFDSRPTPSEDTFLTPQPIRAQIIKSLAQSRTSAAQQCMSLLIRVPSLSSIYGSDIIKRLGHKSPSEKDFPKFFYKAPSPNECIEFIKDTESGWTISQRWDFLSRRMCPAGISAVTDYWLRELTDKDGNSILALLTQECRDVPSDVLDNTSCFIHFLGMSTYSRSLPNDVDETKLKSFLLSLICVPYISLRALAVKLLCVNFGLIGTNSPKRRRIEAGETITKITSELQELVTTPDTFDSANQKIHLITNLKNEVRKLPDGHFLLELTAHVLISTFISPFTILWKPAIAALNEVYQSCSSGSGAHTVLKPLTWVLRKTLNTLLHRSIDSGDRKELLIVQSAKRRRIEKIDGEIALVNVQIDKGEAAIVKSILPSTELTVDIQAVTDEKLRKKLSFNRSIDPKKELGNICEVLTDIVKDKTSRRYVKCHYLDDEEFFPVLVSLATVWSSKLVSGHTVVKPPGGLFSESLFSLAGENAPVVDGLVPMVKLVAAGVNALSLDKAPTILLCRLDELLCRLVSKPLSFPSAALQSAILQLLSSVRISAERCQEGILSELQRVAWTDLKLEELVGGKEFKSKIQDLTSKINEDLSPLASDLLVQICFSKLIGASGRKRTTDRISAVAFLSNLGPHAAAYLFTLMIAPLFDIASDPHVQAPLRQMLMQSDKGLEFDEESLFKVTLKGDIRCAVAQPTDSIEFRMKRLKRLGGFLTLLETVVHQFRQFAAPWICGISDLLARIYESLSENVGSISDPYTKQQTKRAIKQIINLLGSILAMYPQFRETQKGFIQRIGPYLRQQLALNLSNKGCLGRSAVLDFVLRCGRIPACRWILIEEPALLEMVFGAVDTDTVGDALRAGQRPPVAEASLTLVHSLWSTAFPTEDRVRREEVNRKLRNMQREDKKSRQGYHDESGTDSSEEELESDDCMEEITDEGTLHREEAEQLLNVHLTSILRCILATVSAKGILTADLTVIGKEISLLTNFADLPRLRDGSASEDRTLATQLFSTLFKGLIFSLSSTNGLHRSKGRRVEKLVQAMLSLLPAMAQSVNSRCKIEWKTVFTQSGQSDKFRGDSSAEGVLRSVGSLFVDKIGTVNDYSIRELLCELLLGSLLALHTQSNPLETIERKRNAGHPARLRKEDGEELTRILQREIDQLLGDAEISSVVRWDLWTAQVLHALNARSLKSFSDGCDADLQVSILGSLTARGGELSTLDLSSDIWKALLTQFLHMSKQSSLDLGVQIALGKVWDHTFERFARLGHIAAFVVKEGVEGLQISDWWKNEWAFLSRQSQNLVEKIVPFALRCLRSTKRQSVETGISFILRVLHYVSPVAANIPRHFPEKDKLPKPFSPLQPMESLSGAFWLFEDMRQCTAEWRPSKTESVLREFYESVLTDERPFGKRFEGERISAHFTEDMRSLIRKFEPGANCEVYSMLERLTATQKQARVGAFKLMRSILPSLSNYTITRVLIPLAIGDVVQLELSSNNGQLADEALQMLIASIKLISMNDSVHIVRIFQRIADAVHIDPKKKSLVVKALCRIVQGISTFLKKLGESSKEAKYKEALHLARQHLVPILHLYTTGSSGKVGPRKSNSSNTAAGPTLYPEAFSALLSLSRQFDDETFRQILPRLIGSLATSLKSKDATDRKNSRTALTNYLQTLGVSVFSSLLTELRSRAGSGMAAASLMVAVSQMLHATLPVRPNSYRDREEEQKALAKSLPILLEMWNEELERIAGDASAPTASADTKSKHQILATRKKKQAGELSRVEGPLIFGRLAANLALETVIDNLIPSVMRSFNPKDKRLSYNPKYRQRVSDVLRAIFEGLSKRPQEECNAVFEALAKHLEGAIGIIILESSRKEVTFDFKNFRGSHQVEELEKLGLSLLGQSKSTVVKDPRAISKSEQLYTVQPGAANGSGIKLKRTAYEASLQGRLLGGECLKVIAEHLKERASGSFAHTDIETLRGLAKVCTDLLPTLIDCLMSGVTEFVIPAGRALWRIQRILTVNKGSEPLRPLRERLLSEGSHIGRAIVRIFGLVPPKPNQEQARLALCAMDLVKFFLDSPEVPQWLSMTLDQSHENSHKYLRGALLAHIDSLVCSPYTTGAMQSVKVGAVGLLHHVIRSVVAKPKRGGIRASQNENDVVARLSELQFTEDEVRLLYHVTDELIKVATLQAGLGMSFGEKGSSTVSQAARACLVTFFKSFPLKPNAFDERIDHLLKYLFNSSSDVQRAAMNCLASLIDELPREVLLSRLGQPLWFCGGRALKCLPHNQLEHRMLRMLLGRVLERLTKSELSNWIVMASKTYRNDLTSLMELTVVAFRELASDEQRFDLDLLIKSMSWVSGCFQLDQEVKESLEWPKSELIPDLHIPLLTKEVQRLTILQQEALNLALCSPAVQSWARHPDKRLTFVFLLGFCTVWEGTLKSAKYPKALGLAAAANLLELASSNTLTQSLLFTNFIDGASDRIERLTPPEEKSHKAVKILLSAIRDTAKDVDLFDLYQSGWGACALGLAAI